MLKHIHTIFGVSLMMISSLYTEAQETASEKKSPEVLPAQTPEAKKTILALLINKENHGSDAQAQIEQALKEKGGEVQFLIIDKDEDDHTDFLEQHRLNGEFPLPLVVIISQQNVPFKIIKAKDISIQNLMESIPTPVENKLIDSVIKEKSVIIIASLADFSDREATLTAALKAQKSMPQSLDIIELDLHDKKEAAFIKRLNIPSDSKETYSVVINKQSDITGKFKGVPEAKSIEDAAKQEKH